MVLPIPSFSGGTKVKVNQSANQSTLSDIILGINNAFGGSTDGTLEGTTKAQFKNTNSTSQQDFDPAPQLPGFSDFNSSSTNPLSFRSGGTTGSPVDFKTIGIISLMVLVVLTSLGFALKAFKGKK